MYSWRSWALICDLSESIWILTERNKRFGLLLSSYFINLYRSTTGQKPPPLSPFPSVYSFLGPSQIYLYFVALSLPQILKRMIDIIIISPCTSESLLVNSEPMTSMPPQQPWYEFYLLVEMSRYFGNCLKSYECFSTVTIKNECEITNEFLAFLMYIKQYFGYFTV